MTPTIRLVLALLPLAGYFALLGYWHSGRKPRIVPGQSDFAALASGLGGLIAFGPIGDLVVNRLFPLPSTSAWLAMASLVGLLAMIWAARARKRLVIYQAEARTLDAAVARSLESLAVPVTRTLHGYEDAPNRRGVRLETGRLLGYAVIEAYGEHPESLINAIRSALLRHLNGPTHIRTSLVALYFGLAGGTLAVLGIALAILTRAEMHAAIRRIGG